MPTNQVSAFAERYVGDFLREIEPLRDAYRNDSFSYLAVKTSDGLVLIQGSLFLNIQAPTIPLKVIDTKRVQAGHFYLSQAGLTREEAIKKLLTGKLTVPSGSLSFPTSGGGQYGARYQPYHEIGLRTQSRLLHLSILGAETGQYLEQPNLDWDLRAASVPYDGIQDLLNEFRPGLMQGLNCVEIVAFNVAAVDADSVVNGEVAKLIVRTGTWADEKKVSVGVRVLEQGRVVDRKQILAEAFEWRDQNGFKIGAFCFPVPQAAVVHGIANYGGVTQQHFYFGDPTSFQNPRRAGYESFDPKLAAMQDILVKTRNMRSSRDFEAAMSWLFWMLGFAPAYLGGLPETSNAADFIAVTPGGNIAVVECTVGLLKDNDKLPKLYERIQAVRRNLETSSTRHLRVLPVIITAKLAEEVRPDIEQAEKLGIYVLSREAVEALLQRTLFPQNADRLYEEAEQAVKNAKEAREGQFALPLVDAPNLPGQI